MLQTLVLTPENRVENRAITMRLDWPRSMWAVCSRIRISRKRMEIN